MAERDVLAQRLAEAEAAVHALATGRQAVEVEDGSGRRVRRTPADLARLRLYAGQLAARIAALDALPAAARRPIHVRF